MFTRSFARFLDEVEAVKVLNRIQKRAIETPEVTTSQLLRSELPDNNLGKIFLNFILVR